MILAIKRVYICYRKQWQSKKSYPFLSHCSRGRYDHILSAGMTTRAGRPTIGFSFVLHESRQSPQQHTTITIPPYFHVLTPTPPPPYDNTTDSTGGSSINGRIGVVDTTSMQLRKVVLRRPVHAYEDGIWYRRSTEIPFLFFCRQWRKKGRSSNYEEAYRRILVTTPPY